MGTSTSQDQECVTDDTVADEHVVDITGIDNDVYWESCCIRLDRDAVGFFAQLGVSVTAMGFCMFQLIKNEECEAQSLYSGVLTLVVGTWLPQPRLTRRQ